MISVYGIAVNVKYRAGQALLDYPNRIGRLEKE